MRFPHFNKKAHGSSLMAGLELSGKIEIISHEIRKRLKISRRELLCFE